jgi:beta-galactosidase
MFFQNSFKSKYYFAKPMALVLILLLSIFSSFAQIKSNIERKKLFDFDWKFYLGDTSSARLKEFNDMAWRSLDLPHDWSIEGRINPKNPTGNAGGFFPAGIAWYRKTFKASDDRKGKNISIYFEGVYMNSEVFINGKSLGVYPYGYSLFSYDITPYLDFDLTNKLFNTLPTDQIADRLIVEVHFYTPYQFCLMPEDAD